MQQRFDCLALFSSGLDSILACKLMQLQGIRVLGVHFSSPFFGNEDKIPYWEETYQIPLLPVDISSEYIELLQQGPRWGLGKNLNPCVDCKILMLKKIREMLPEFGAQWMVTGEVLGQRQMSQRRSILNLITKQAGMVDQVLRPLSAKLLSPTSMEISGQVDRERLLDFQGRGRKKQLDLARNFDIQDIPTPAGGCLLTDPSASKRFFYVLRNIDSPRIQDFQICRIGRQFWYNKHWLIIGRNSSENSKLLELTQPEDLVFKLSGIPGPIALGRQSSQKWDQELIQQAARFALNFSSRAKNATSPVQVLIGYQGRKSELNIHPGTPLPEIWHEPSSETFQNEKKHFWM